MEVLSKAQGADRLSLVNSLTVSIAATEFGASQASDICYVPFSCTSYSHTEQPVTPKLFGCFQCLAVSGKQLGLGAGGIGAVPDRTAKSAVSKQKLTQFTVSHI